MPTLDEELLRLATENETLKAEIERTKEGTEQLQIDFANKVATKTVEFETREIDYKKQIKELTLSLELRNSNERGKERDKSKKSVNQIWEEITGESK